MDAAVLRGGGAEAATGRGGGVVATRRGALRGENEARLGWGVRDEAHVGPMRGMVSV